MATDLKIDIAAEFTGKKAFKQADNAAVKLTGSVKKLAAGLGVAFGARAAGIYAKNAVKAFAADEKAAKALTLTLTNLGMAFADPEVKRFISSLESQYGVLDDLLRPAYQKLLTTTGDYVKAQELLKTSLDLSAMSGADVVTVSSDLAKAYAGNTRGLIKYGLGLSKTEIAAMSFEDILKQIATVSSGQAQAAADSYAGSLDRLTVAFANASETIGQDLLTALDTVAGGNGLPKTIKLVETLSSGVGDAIVGFSRLIRNIGILASGNPLESIRDLQKVTREDRLADMKERAQFGGIYADIYKSQAAALATGKKNLSISKATTKETAAQLKAKQLSAAIDKANLALGKSSSVFDLDKIQLAAAEKSQVEQLGKVTSQAQLLAITNDLARLRVKKDILDLEDAIASGDVKAIESATAKLNADTKILGVLTGQELKMTEIKSILDTIAPKDLINLDNLNEAIRLLGVINAGNIANAAGSNAFTPTQQSVAQVIAARVGTDISGATDPRVTYGGQRIDSAGNYTGFNPEMLGMTSGGSSASTPISITVNTGIGDPNAIAEAIDQVLTDAVQRGTLRGTLVTS